MSSPIETLSRTPDLSREKVEFTRAETAMLVVKGMLGGDKENAWKVPYVNGAIDDRLSIQRINSEIAAGAISSERLATLYDQRGIIERDQTLMINQYIGQAVFEGLPEIVHLAIKYGNEVATVEAAVA